MTFIIIGIRMIRWHKLDNEHDEGIQLYVLSESQRFDVYKEQINQIICLPKPDVVSKAEQRRIQAVQLN